MSERKTNAGDALGLLKWWYQPVLIEQPKVVSPNEGTVPERVTAVVHRLLITGKWLD
jgi:hypothetical protein